MNKQTGTDEAVSGHVTRKAFKLTPTSQTENY